MVLEFDSTEVYGEQAGPALAEMLAGRRTKEDVAFNTLGVAKGGLDAFLAAPFYLALEGKSGCALTVSSPEPAPDEQA